MVAQAFSGIAKDLTKISSKSAIRLVVPQAAQSSLFKVAVPGAIALALQLNAPPNTAIVGGLIIFGVVFAFNSAVHSYLVLAFTDDDKVALNVGFYYMANSGGRLVGTVLSVLVY